MITKNIILNFLVQEFLLIFFKVVMIFFSLGIVLNIFEEIEFFKGMDVNIFMPLILSCFYVPNTIIQILPFVVFIASLWFLLKIRNNKELLLLKIFGYSNLKIFFILATTSFFLGWFILVLVNPITSSMITYYEKTKSAYSKDIDHLITFNKNGLWIKEKQINGMRIVSAEKANESIIENILIYNFDNNYKLKNKIYAKNADISNNKWKINDVNLLDLENEQTQSKEIKNLSIESIYTIDKINNLFKNFDTISFFDLTFSYDKLLKKGYDKSFLNQSLHSMLSLPFFLMIMTALAATFTLNTMKKSNNYKFIIIGLLSVIIIYYFKDLSLALGKTERISLELANWMPVFAVGLFTFIGVLQINEK